MIVRLLLLLIGWRACLGFCIFSKWGRLSSSSSLLFSALTRESIDSLIKSNLRSIVEESGLLKGILPPSSPSAITINTLKKEEKEEEMEREFDRLCFITESESDKVSLYNNLLQAWYESNRFDVGERCEEVLARMRFADVEPNEETYHIVISLWTSLEKPSATKKAFSYFVEAVEKGFILRSEVYKSLVLSLHQYSWGEVEDKFHRICKVMKYIDIHRVKSSDPLAAVYAEALLFVSLDPVAAISDLLSNLQEDDDSSPRHRFKVEQFYIRALCRNSSFTNEHLKQAEQRLRELSSVQVEILPDSAADYVSGWIELNKDEISADVDDFISFLNQILPSGKLAGQIVAWNDVLRFLGNNISPENGHRMLEILRRLIDDGAPVNSDIFENVIISLCKLEEMEVISQLVTSMLDINVVPSYNTLAAVIRTQLRLYNSSSTTLFNPSIDEMFSILLHQPHSLVKCQSLLANMTSLGYRLSFPTFKTYLQCLSSTKIQGSAEVAILLFKQIEKSRASAAIDVECFEYLYQTFETSLSLSQADNAWNALQYMKSLNVTPSTKIYNSLLTTWVNSRRPDAPRMCENILDLMAKNGLTAATSSYNIALRAWSRSLLPNAALKARELLNAMDSLNVTADAESIALVGYAVSKAKRTSGDALNYLEDLYRRLWAILSLQSFSPDSSLSTLKHLQSMHRSLISAWSSCREPDCLDKLSALLEAMTVHKLFPHPSAYTIIASAWGTESVYRSRALLNRLIDRGVKGPSLAIPYNMLLASGRRSVSANAAEDLFAAMASEFPPDIVSLNLLLEAVGRDSSKDAVRRCDAILEQMTRSYGLVPSDYTFLLMSRLWASLPSKEAVARMDFLFSLLVEPSLKSYAALVGGWCKVNTSTASTLIDKMMLAAGESEFVVESSVYYSLIDALARSKQPLLAEKLLRNFLAYYPSVRPDARAVSLILEALARVGKQYAAQAHDLLDFTLSRGVILDADLVHWTISAWARAGEGAGLGRAERLFSRAKKENIVLKAATLRFMLQIFGRMRDAADRAEAILLQLLDLYPAEVDLVCFNIVIEAWGKSSWMHAGTRAELIFQRLVKSSAHYSPDVITFSSLMSAISKNATAESILKAEGYFQLMQSMGVLPDSRAYTTLLTIVAKSKLRDKEERVRSLFSRMQADGCSASTVTYTAMLAMYGSSRDPEAGRYIVDIFRRIKEEGLALDTVGYSSLLSALGKSKEGHSALQAETIFEEMIAAGVPPDATAWNIIISIWSRSSLAEKYNKIDSLYDRMIASGCVPNGFLLTTLLKVWTFSKHPFAAARIKTLYEYLNSSNIALDGFGFKALIAALLRIMSPAAAFDRIEALLSHMLDFGHDPETSCFTASIKLDPAPKAYERGLRYIRMIKNAGKVPSIQIYRAVLETLEKARQDSRTAEVQRNLIKEITTFEQSRLGRV